MLSRPQQILLKRAQREAGLQDLEYRDALAAVSGCRSSTDPKLTDRHVDLALAYFEAIYWRGVDSGTLQPASSHNAVFRQRGYWAKKNPPTQTSRDRFNQASIESEVSRLEAELGGLGFGPAYLAGIRQRATRGSSQAEAEAERFYAAALKRTLRAKRRPNNAPF